MEDRGAQEGTKSRFIVTLRPESTIEEIEEYAQRGVNEFRITLSSPHHRKGATELLKRVARVRKRGFPISIMVDLPGSKVRVRFPADYSTKRVLLQDGEECVFCLEEKVEEMRERIPPQRLFILDTLPQELKKGMRFYISDGYRTFEIVEMGKGWVKARAIGETPVTEGRGVNFPGLLDTLPSVTSTDKKWLRELPLYLREEIDKIAISFVNSPAAIRELREWLVENGGFEHVLLVAKIETLTGLQYVEQIAKETDEVMVARGDLEVELRGDPQKRTLWQAEQRIVKAAKNAGKPFIIATRVGESLVNGEQSLSEEEKRRIKEELKEGPVNFMLSGEVNSFEHNRAIENFNIIHQAVLEAEKEQ